MYAEPVVGGKAGSTREEGRLGNVLEQLSSLSAGAGLGRSRGDWFKEREEQTS